MLSAAVGVGLQATVGSTAYLNVNVSDSDQTDMTISHTRSGLQLTLTNKDTFATSLSPGSVTGLTGISGLGTKALTISSLRLNSSLAALANFSVNMNSGAGPGGSITVTPGTTISTAGSISLTGTGDSDDPIGVTINDATLNANGENIALTGIGWNPGVAVKPSGANHYGVEIEGGAQIKTADVNGVGGKIAITGIGSVMGTGGGAGVCISASTVSAMDGSLTITGTGNGTGSRTMGLTL